MSKRVIAAVGLLTAMAVTLLAMPAADAQEVCFEEVLTTFVTPGDDYNLTASFTESALAVVDCPEDEVLSITETPDEVLGVTELAFTGSTTSKALTVGISLIGAGGLALYGARRRTERDEAEELA